MLDLISALSLGAIYALIAVGYNVIYRTTSVFNFAQGAMVAVGSLVVYSAVNHWGVGALGAILVVVAAGIGIGTAQEMLAIRPILARAPSSEVWLVSTVGVSVILEAAAELIWGSDPHQVNIGWLNHLVSVGDGSVPVAAFVAIGAALAAALGLDLWYARARLGKVFSAVAEDREASEARGINTRRVGLASFAIAGGIAGAVGFLVAPLTYAQSDLGDLLALDAFVAMAIGGFGSNRGALIGGVAVGVVQEYAGVILGVQYQAALVFVLLLVTLLLIPQGLFGRRSGRTV